MVLIGARAGQLLKLAKGRRVYMPLGDFAEAGTASKPLPIGRMGRLLFGAGTLSYFVWNILQVSDRVDSDVPPIGYLIGVAVAWWYFSDQVVVGFSRNWGCWPQAAVLPFVLALVVVNLLAYESTWGPPLGWGLFLFTEFLFGHIGISFVLAAIFRGAWLRVQRCASRAGADSGAQGQGASLRGPLHPSG